ALVLPSLDRLTTMALGASPRSIVRLPTRGQDADEEEDMKISTWSIAPVVAILLAVPATWAHQAGTTPERIGQVTFPTSFTPACAPRGRAAEMRPGGRAAALVLVSRVCEGFHRRDADGSRLRHGVLGHRDEPLVPDLVAAESGECEARRRGDRKGQLHRRQDA